MNKIKQLSLVSLIFSLLPLLYPVTEVSAQDGICSLADQCEEYASKKKKRKHVNCLRSLLHENAPNFTTPSKDRLGHWGCGSRDRAQHIGCLKDLLYQHTAGGTGVPPGDQHASEANQVMESEALTKPLHDRIAQLEGELSAALRAARTPANPIAAEGGRGGADRLCISAVHRWG